MYHQHKIHLPPYPRGFHLITDEIVKAVPELANTSVGLLHVFVLHTSASLTINENADPDVRHDMAVAAAHLCPEGQLPFIHTCEGLDDMPAHVMSSLMGSSVTIPVTDGHLNLGTWQGIYLCEHRNQGGSRNLVLTLQGSS